MNARQNRNLRKGLDMSRRFAGKRALVTGGTSAIGRELAVALAGAGADMAVTGTGERSLAALAARQG